MNDYKKVINYLYHTGQIEHYKKPNKLGIIYGLFIGFVIGFILGVIK